MLKAIIFDLDGVICSTDEYHYRAWKTLADSLGLPFDREKNNRLRGVSRMASLDIVLEDSPLTYTQTQKAEMADRKNGLYRQLLAEMSQEAILPGVLDTLDALRAMGLKLAVGSSSKNTPFILDRIGLADVFQAISDGNNITRSKPDPEVFLKAAAFLGEKPEDCLVVEDAVPGAQAGHAGGFPVACVGDAAENRAGDYNLTAFPELISVVKERLGC